MGKDRSPGWAVVTAAPIGVEAALTRNPSAISLESCCWAALRVFSRAPQLAFCIIVRRDARMLIAAPLVLLVDRYWAELRRLDIHTVVTIFN